MRTLTAKLRPKLLLSVFAVSIALASLLYTSNLVRHLQERERTAVTIWAAAIEQVAHATRPNPYQSDLRAISDGLDSSDPMTPRYRAALGWAADVPMGDQMDFIFDVMTKHSPDVPAAIVDEQGHPVRWQHIGVSEEGQLSSEDSLTVRDRIAEMDRNYDPIRIEIAQDSLTPALIQRVHYGESSVIRDLRIYPYLQLTFVALFIGFGYLGFSYARRSEQSNLWVGMAREAAHQLGTPISSLMGWVEVMRGSSNTDQDILKEMDADLKRLELITQRFNDIGSQPKLINQSIAPIIDATANYVRRRFPRRGMSLDVEVSHELISPVNSELFAWVIENLLKNAMDAIESEEGRIQIKASTDRNRVYIDVIDNGKGVDRRDWSNIFKPGFSTKTRGWGLGLSLAKRIIEDYHGGDLTLIQSTIGKGSTFRILLPSDSK
ncbi:MAG: ATP-binding protein [Bacteroidetes bacterium]|nr:ATP-binding protein [Bacteroidota bacterium]MCY4232470.1 ATP-binding protein [Bacteroidota bacterium]